MRIGFKRAFLLTFTAILAGPLGCSSSLESSFLRKRAHKDYYILTSQLHSYKQEFKKVDKLLTKATKFFPRDKQIGLYHAHIKASRGDLVESSKLFSELVEAHPEDSQVLEAAAEFYRETGRKEVALLLYSELQKLNPSELNYRIYLGRLFLELGQIREAASHFIYVADQKTDDSYKGHYQLGKLYKMTGQPAKALTAFSQCSFEYEGCLLESAEMNWVIGNKNRVFNMLERFLNYKPRSVRVLAALTDFYYSEEKFIEAGSTLERIERIDPSNRSVKRRLAQLMIRNENYQGALERYELLISQKEEEEDLINLAHLYILVQNYPGAFDQLQKIKASSKFYDDLFSMKYKLYMLNESPLAAHAYINKEFKKSKNLKAGYILARSYLQKDDFSKALKTLDYLIKKEPVFIEALSLRGMITYEMGKADKSMPYFEKVISLDANHSSALNFVAYHLAETRTDLDRAYSLAMRALAIDPNEGHYLDTMGFVLFQKEDFGQARPYLEQAQKQLPKDPIVAEHLADLYSKLGLSGKAIEMYLLALPALKGDNLVRVGGKIARIKSIRKLSSVSDQ